VDDFSRVPLGGVGGGWVGGPETLLGGGGGGGVGGGREGGPKFVPGNSLFMHDASPLKGTYPSFSGRHFFLQNLPGGGGLLDIRNPPPQ
jgi:hypothetical protein